MPTREFDVVTGAFGFTGKYITRLLLDRGRSVRTLTSRAPDNSPFGREVGLVPFDFDRPDQLAASLAGAATLYNTYWIRFARGQTTFEKAIANTRALVSAAERAGVRRVVHISVTNASSTSPLPYFRGKGLVEEFIAASKLTHAILRPAVVFGDEGALINNLAWFLRKLPVFGVPGNGRYRLRPVFVEDMARLAVEQGQKTENVTIDAIGPENPTFDELLRMVADAVGARPWIVHLPRALGLLGTTITGWMVGDVVMTRAELTALAQGLLTSEQPASGPTRLSEWLEQNADRVGQSYMSDLKRHYGPRR